MLIRNLLEYANIAELTMSILVLLVMWRKRALSEFPILGVYLGVQSVSIGITTPLLFFRKDLHIPLPIAYAVYVDVYWISYAVQALLLVLIIRSVFSIAMRPLEGLHEIGKIIFRWVTAVSCVLSVCVVSASFFTTGGKLDASAVTTLASQIQQGVSILTLCLLLFVCFAARPLGLTFRSRLFGVSLGLGVMAATSLVEAAWYASGSAKNLYSPVYLVSIGGGLAALIAWGTYFVMPEPERKMILLPTTSPFFFWNRVSEALGDNPGQVAVAGFKPDMLAPGELSALTAMGKASREQQESLPALPSLQSASGLN